MLSAFLITVASEWILSEPPHQVRSSYAVACAHGSYKFEIVQRLKSQPLPAPDWELKISTVELARFKRSSAPVSRKLKAQMESVFEQFESIRSVSISCGVTKNGKAADFLQVKIGGRHRDNGAEAKAACRGKNFSFDQETHREIVIDGDNMVVRGDEIGRCYDPYAPTQALE